MDGRLTPPSESLLETVRAPSVTDTPDISVSRACRALTNGPGPPAQFAVETREQDHLPKRESVACARLVLVDGWMLLLSPPRGEISLSGMYSDAG